MDFLFWSLFNRLLLIFWVDVAEAGKIISNGYFVAQIRSENQLCYALGGSTLDSGNEFTRVWQIDCLVIAPLLVDLEIGVKYDLSGCILGFIIRLFLFIIENEAFYYFALLLNKVLLFLGFIV